MSWANLDCCGGWSFDEEYLRHAVQNEKKLYADISISLKDRYFPDAPTTPEAIASLYQLQDTLPDTLCAGIDNRISNNKHLNIYICRRGAIKDFFSLNIVFLFYQKLGIHLSDQTKDEVSRYCAIEISDFSSSAAPYVYYDASSPAELITTGLLLGYPIESTASLLEGFWCIQVEEIEKQLRLEFRDIESDGCISTSRELDSEAKIKESRFQFRILTPMREAQVVLSDMRNSTLVAISGMESLDCIN